MSVMRWSWRGDASDPWSPVDVESRDNIAEGTEGTWSYWEVLPPEEAQSDLYPLRAKPLR